MNRRYAIVLTLCLACHSSRPGVEDWLAAWTEVQAAVPDPAAIEADASRAPCEKLLSATRSLHARLLPSPDAALDGPIEEWLARAGQIGFDCPTAHGELDTYRKSARELAVLKDEIDAGVATTRRLEGEPDAAG